MMFTFEGPGISFAWPGFLFSLTWRGITVHRHRHFHWHRVWFPKR